MSGTYSFDEWFCVVLARTIKNGETAFHGFSSPCATIAMHVAKRSHAPEMVLIEGATYAVDPSPRFLTPTSNDWALMSGASLVLRFEDLFDLGARGDLHRMFLSGGQIDAFGNTNVTMIGSPDEIKVKMGGGGGGCNLSATVAAITLWTTRHRTGRALVGCCDFITDIGHRTPAGTRSQLGFPGGGPEVLVTELGVFDFLDGRARLSAVFPDVSLDDVVRATGFEIADENVAVVAAPDRASIARVRELDPLNVRRREFGDRDLERRFAFTLNGNVAASSA